MMLRFRLPLLIITAVAGPPRLQAQTVDTAGTGAVLTQARDQSQVMQNLQYLADNIGPRLAGSAAMKRANDWTMERFKSYGLDAHIEAFPFGVTWERGEVNLRLVQPFSRQIMGHSWAWTAGTGGKRVTGAVTRINGTPDSLDHYLAQVKGKWVLLAEPAFIWNPDGPPMTAADSLAMKEAQGRRTAMFQRMQGDQGERVMREFRQALYDRAFRLKAAGALGVLTDGGKEFGLLTMSGSPNSVSPLPNLVIAHEDYAMIDRLLQAGTPPVISGRVTNTLGSKPVEQYNTVADITGSEKPDEVVILGAHLDSWDLGQGVTDNGTGSMVVLEAARAIVQSGVRPKRTLRFILFSAEEEGLIGSAAYAAQHAADMDKVQAVLVLDNGTGMITGQALQGREEFEQLWKDLLAPVAHLGAKNVRAANKGGTDHLSFLPYGVPGFNFDQETRGYNHTHHSQVDTYDHAVAGDLKQASAVMAVTALELANLGELLPRGVKREVTPPRPMKPSAGLAAK
jgi:hypothetical protein